MIVGTQLVIEGTQPVSVIRRFLLCRIVDDSDATHPDGIIVIDDAAQEKPLYIGARL